MRTVVYRREGVVAIYEYFHITTTVLYNYKLNGKLCFPVFPNKESPTSKPIGYNLPISSVDWKSSLPATMHLTLLNYKEISVFFYYLFPS
jgi:hypothetical protein